MKKTIKQNSEGGTEVHFLNHVVTVQPSVGSTTPDGWVSKSPKGPTTIWMKLDRGKWIQSIEPSVMKTVERLMTMKPEMIFSIFHKK
jgi:hypothetical protein